jgi:hypothetical protein
LHCLGRTAESGAKDDNSAAFMDFGDEDEDVDLEEVRRQQDEEFDFQAILKKATEKKSDKKTSQGSVYCDKSRLFYGGLVRLNSQM